METNLIYNNSERMPTYFEVSCWRTLGAERNTLVSVCANSLRHHFFPLAPAPTVSFQLACLLACLLFLTPDLNTNIATDGALVEQGDADIPVAKLAEENWATATAMAWRRGATSNPASYEQGRQQGEEDPPVSPPAASVSRWRSARAIARQARRVAAAATAHRDVGPPEADGVGWSVDAEQEAALTSSFRSRVSAVANSGLASPVAPPSPTASGEPS